MNTLDQWESAAESAIEAFLRTYTPESRVVQEQKRILALIDLVRKKDEALKKYENTSSSLSVLEYAAREALALTVDVEKELG